MCDFEGWSEADTTVLCQARCRKKPRTPAVLVLFCFAPTLPAFVGHERPVPLRWGAWPWLPTSSCCAEATASWGGSSHGPLRELSFHGFIWGVRHRGVLSFLASLDFSAHFCASGGFVSDSCSDLDFRLSPSKLSLSKVFPYSSKF